MPGRSPLWGSSRFFFAFVFPAWFSSPLIFQLSWSDPRSCENIFLRILFIFYAFTNPKQPLNSKFLASETVMNIPWAWPVCSDLSCSTLPPPPPAHLLLVVEAALSSRCWCCVVLTLVGMSVAALLPFIVRDGSNTFPHLPVGEAPNVAFAFLSPASRRDRVTEGLRKGTQCWAALRAQCCSVCNAGILEQWKTQNEAPPSWDVW
jgi:hypothetical protein